MNVVSIIILVIVIIFVVLTIALVAAALVYFFTTQRRLVNLDELANNSLNQIAVQQNSRYDAVSSLVAMTEKYSKHEHDTLVEVIGQRTGSHSAADINAQSNRITEALSRLLVVAEQYPTLKADSLYAKTMDSINNYENLVRTSSMVYNDCVTKMNRFVRQWPSSFVARILHFDQREYLKIDDEKKKMPPIN